MFTYYKESEEPVNLGNDIAKSARIFNKDMKRPLKPYEEAVNTAAGQLAKDDPTLLVQRGTVCKNFALMSVFKYTYEIGKSINHRVSKSNSIL